MNSPHNQPPEYSHDELFKNLIQTHFQEFIRVCFPTLLEEIDFAEFSSENFLNQEQMAEVGGRLHRLDIFTKVKLKSQPEDSIPW